MEQSKEAVTMEQYVAGVRVLLAACARGALAEGEAAARFLYYRASTLQRHPSLAYSATKAAAQYAALAHDRHRALTVSLATAGMELTDTLELRARTPPRLLQLPGLPTKVFVYATGAGCATVQGTIAYSTYTPKAENTLLNIQAAIIEEIRPERSSIEDLQGNLPTLIIKTCFKWKSKERSGILRLESSLFSGYELYSVNPVVLDGATFADLHYGSRGESIWFVFANISSTCPICVTYEARSKFVITSLRPAFAKIYPSTRPDLAVETFFHARPGSPLLRGITDDDFITWFDKTELASIKTASSIDNICECGRICSRDYEFRKGNTTNFLKSITTKATEATLISSTATVVGHNISKYHISPNTTHNDPDLSTAFENYTINVITPTGIILPINNITGVMTTDDPIIVPTSTYLNKSIEQHMGNNLEPIQSKLNEELIIQKTSLSKSIIKKDDYKKKPLPRRKGTLKATYGDKHETFFVKPENVTLNTSIQLVDNITKHIDDVFIKSQGIADLLNPVVQLNTNKRLILPTNTMSPPVHILETSNDNKPKNTSSYSSERVSEPLFMHTIATITNNNIKSMHHRTKKPKSITQIKKLEIYNQSIINDTNYENTTEIMMNKTKKKALPLKHTTTGLKSINKEIHKIPPTPMSETSKTLSDIPNVDIAPENKRGFDILDKSYLWELLKEGSNTDSTTVEDKLHNRLHTIPLNISNVEFVNRSL